VVSKVEENLGLGVGLENFASNRSVTSEDLNEVGSSNLVSRVVNLASASDVDSSNTSAGWLVEELASERVLG